MDRKKTEEYLAREKAVIYESTVEEVILKSGKGAWIENIDGNKFLDFTSQVCLLNTGYGPKPVLAALRKQLDSGVHSCISADFPYVNRVKIGGKAYEVSRAALAEKLIEITEPIMPFPKRVGFEVSGATAVNFALKIAKITYARNHWGSVNTPENCFPERIFSPRSNGHFSFGFLGFKGAFNGRHGEAHCFTNSKAVQFWGASSSCAFGRLTFPMAESLSEAIVGEAQEMINELRTLHCPVIAFVFEPVQGEGGINFPDESGLNLLVDYLRDTGIYIIADEIQSGMGRIGKMFACEHFGIQPDMIVLSKSLGAGLPIGAVVANAEKFPNLERGMHSGSHHATPLAVAAAMANIDLIQRCLKNDRVLKLGEYALNELKILAALHSNLISGVAGLGFMLRMEFCTKEIRDKVIEKSREYGVILAGAGEKAIRLYPPLVISRKDLDKGLGMIYSALEDIQRGQK